MGSKKLLWHFKRAVPEWFPKNFRKAWYKARRYLSNIHSNLLFYLQTETYVSRPLQPPSFSSRFITALIYCCRISPALLAASFIPPLVASVYHHFSSVIAVASSRDDAHLRSHCLPLLWRWRFSIIIVMCLLGPLHACICNFLETHICCFRAQRDRPWQGLFEVASQGEPKPEQEIWKTIKKR